MAEAEQPITVPCKIHFDRGNCEESTIKFLFEDIPFVFRFSALYNFGIENGNDKLSLANLYVNDDRTICSLLDIRNYCQTGRFAPPNDRREVTREDQADYEEPSRRTERIINIISAGSETSYAIVPPPNAVGDLAPQVPLYGDLAPQAPLYGEFGPQVLASGLVVTPVFWGKLKLAVTLTNFIYIITESDAMADRDLLQRLYPIPYEDYYNNPEQANPENIIFQIFQKLYQTFPNSVDGRIFRHVRVGGKKKNGRRSCRTRYKAKHAKHSKSKKRYRKSKKRMLRS